MTEDRPYQSAKTPEEAIAELRRCSGTQFRPNVVEILCELLEERLSAVEEQAQGRLVESVTSKVMTVKVPRAAQPIGRQ